jgi:hypothetical protein
MVCNDIWQRLFIQCIGCVQLRPLFQAGPLVLWLPLGEDVRVGRVDTRKSGTPCLEGLILTHIFLGSPGERNETAEMVIRSPRGVGLSSQLLQSIC